MSLGCVIVVYYERMAIILDYNNDFWWCHCSRLWDDGHYPVIAVPPPSRLNNSLSLQLSGLEAATNDFLSSLSTSSNSFSSSSSSSSYSSSPCIIFLIWTIQARNRAAHTRPCHSPNKSQRIQHYWKNLIFFHFQNQNQKCIQICHYLQEMYYKPKLYSMVKFIHTTASN